jgi:hypothetical protein
VILIENQDQKALSQQLANSATDFKRNIRSEQHSHWGAA